MRYPLTASALLVAVGLVVACEDDPVAPATTGSISLEFVIPSDSGGSAGAAPAAAAPAEGTADAPTSPTMPVLKKTTFDGARATAIGPQTKEVMLTLVGSNWQGTIDALTPGTYRVIVEGLVAGVVDWYGEASGVSVTAGGNTTATVTFDTFVPVLDAVASPTTSTSVTVTLPSMTFATSYTVQWDTDPAFGGPQTLFNVGTSVDIDVPGPGVYYVRAQAVNSLVPGGVWSDAVSFEVVGSAFTGNLSIASGGFADQLVITRDPGIPWDGDEWVEIGGVEPWYVAQHLNTITVLVPDVPLGIQTIEIGDQGPGQVSQTANFNITSRFTPHTNPLTAPDLTGGPFPMEFYISLSTASADDFYTLAPGTDQGLRVIIEWQTLADIDIYWMDEFASFDVFNYDGAGASNPEMSTATLPGGLTWRLLLTKWDVTEPPTMARVRVETVALGLITAGQNHSCGLTQSGDVFCWGYNGDGQLGNNTTDFSNTPVLVSGALNFRSVSAGTFYTCGLDGSTAYCWGYNGSGQLGDGTYTNSLSPNLVPGVALATVDAGPSHACGVDGAGQAYCWGANWDGQLGDGTSGSSVPSPTPVSGAFTFVRISTGASHSCGIDVIGDAYCWGRNVYGQLGNNTTTDATTPQPVSGGYTWYDIDAGWWTTCGITNTREVYCWGSGSYLGDGSGADSPVPVLAVSAIGNFEQISNAQHTCAVTSDGDVYCWGSGYYGQGGDGSTDWHSSPVQVASNEFFRSVSAGTNHTCGGTDAGTAHCWGRNNHGQLGDANTPFVFPQDVGMSVQNVEAGSYHVCAIDGSGLTHCWGLGGSGQLGNGQYSDSDTPVLVSAPAPFQRVSAGRNHTCGTTTGQQAYCWGYNYYGQLGDGGTVNASTPVAVTGGLAYNWVNAAAWHSCGVTAAGSVRCWGRNSNSQLGDGTLVDASIPVAVSIPETVQRVYGGYGHSCALATSGTIYCWGANGSGQLGDGTFTDRPTPVAITGYPPFTRLRVGSYHTCGIDNLGASYCWGAGWDGRIGDGSTTSRNLPTLISGPFQRINAGDAHTCGINGTTGYCWGYNRFGVIGNGTKTEEEPLPLAVGGGLGFQKLSAGGQFTCGITTSGALYCWGENSNGQLGLGYRSIETRPVQVTGGLVLRAPREVTATPPRGGKARDTSPKR